jgi:hypothetical protein
LNHRLLLLSNGHGEDLSGALLGQALLQRGVPVEALPLVGRGEAYRKAGLAVLGSGRDFSTGGLGYTSLGGRLTELREGQYLDVLRRLARLAERRHNLIVAVGDVLPVVAAWLSRRPVVVYLVAYSSHYEGKLRLPWPCGALLRRPRFRRIWSRDALTGDDLSHQLNRPVTFLGNPFLDPVAPEPGGIASTPISGAAQQRLAVLPGSRLPEAERNLALMLQVLALLPEPLQQPQRLALQAALVGDLDRLAVERLAAPLGWRLEPGQGEPDGQAASVLRRGSLRLQLHWGRFPAVLRGCDLALSMTGTAAEQAVGLGKPVLQLEGGGPQFTAGFAEAQRRLLGPGVLCAPGGSGHAAASARLAAALLQRLDDPLQGRAWRVELAELGAQRIGRPGGSDRMAEAIMELLPALQPAG